MMLTIEALIVSFFYKLSTDNQSMDLKKFATESIQDTALILENRKKLFKYKTTLFDSFDTWISIKNSFLYKRNINFIESQTYLTSIVI